MQISFFDLDHTLLNANSSYRFGVYLYRHKVFTFAKMVHLTLYYALHKMGLISLMNLHHHSFRVLFKGMPYEAIENQVAPFLNQELEAMLYKPAVERLRLAQQAGHYTVILSSSPDFLVKPIAQRFGVNECDATHYSLDNQRKFCQISNVLEGLGKAKCVATMLQRLNENKEMAAAYSDSHLDLPFLESVGKAIAVNPDRKLRNISIRNNWEII